MAPDWLKKLEGDLKELERTDPKVSAAKRNLDKAVQKLTSRPIPPALFLLDGDELTLGVFGVATPTALRGVLLDRAEVTALREALLSGTVTELDVARWVAMRSQDFKQGTQFAHEVAFCALVVALEAVPTPSTKKFLEEMAASQAAELTMLSKVAEEVLKARAEAKIDPPPDALELVGQGKCQCGVEYIVVRQAGVESMRHKAPVCEVFARTGRISLNRKEQRAMEARKK
jgi:hypothetical protein